jgi:hypothetical protein
MSTLVVHTPHVPRETLKDALELLDDANASQTHTQACTATAPLIYRGLAANGVAPLPVRGLCVLPRVTACVEIAVTQMATYPT